jgi:hypothetical protein
MEQLIYELNGKKYLLVEILITEDNHKKIDAICKQCNGIYQGIKEINRGGWFSSAYCVMKFLIPEDQIETFNAED